MPHFVPFCPFLSRHGNAAKTRIDAKSPEIMRFFTISGLGGGRWIRTTEGIASRFTVCFVAWYFQLF